MPPPLTTDRFTLQRIEPEDRPFIFEGLSHPQVIPFYGVRYDSLEATQAQMAFFEALERDGTGQWWKIVSRQSQEALGAIGFNHYQAQHRKAELGYWLLPRFWKQGILTEVMPALLCYMQREKGIHRIEALVEEGNTASNRLLERMGFRHEGTLRDCEMKDGRYISLRVYSLLSTDGAGSGL
ncbi:GNAT family N-acetyltransferase [Pyxidicoccus parkwayensis]|uniref:GNAT family N-acetyltransferase n=1 Tax=Pyxidicoccus parkwayensis TaxID=2813578 RepID=A0ABX7PB35_9BACT|nr:GNAT family protein [Pyxidicoccus parkwaysis]QSQ27652.1 GNAT family N-acetyltransferase [Pyxidicoccus parkwaysis]